MQEKFKRLAIITGATSGIGEATMRKLVAAGFGVVGNGRDVEKLSRLEHEIGSAFCSVAGDVADKKVVKRLFSKANDHFGRDADIIVANAGKGLGGSVKDADLEQFNNIFKINLSGVLYLIQIAAQKMVAVQEQSFPESSADIVIIGSVVGRHISPISAAYGATKFAVHALAEGLRREIGSKGVRVSLVEPGVVLSGFQAGAGYNDRMIDSLKKQFGPLLVGDDIANAVYYIVTQPPHVHVHNIVVRPTRQDYV
jgi:NADP-dependent 3-hydroxy acid dehydrogenase YdfG